jgi:predicted DsbA family dithiol-disulfide isomerase
MQIDVFHDTVCPWCRIGKKHLADALEGWTDKPEDLMVRYHTFFLNPNIPPEGAEFRPYMIAKGGGQFFDAPRRMGAAVGVTFNFEKIEYAPNSLDSHRLIVLAPEVDRPKVIDAVYKAYFEDGKNIGDRAVLVEIARECGMDAEWVAQALEGDEGRDEVLADAEYARNLGVTGVPLFVFDGRYAVSGAQSADTLRTVMQRITDGYYAKANR